VEICASATTLQVGDAVTIVGVPVDIGLPYYQLSLDDEPIVRVTYEGQVTRLEGTNAVFELVSAEGTMRQVTFVLRAQATGTVKAAIGATGEIHYGYPGPATWAGGGSDPIQITVTK
jgi:hypothetical protein